MTTFPRSKALRCPRLTRPEVRVALLAMNEDLGRRWTVTILANLVCLSPSAFYRTFSRHVGTTPMAWLTDARAGEMARLLRETNEPLHVVARRVGWANRGHATHQFKALTGITPSQYRAMCRLHGDQSCLFCGQPVDA